MAAEKNNEVIYPKPVERSVEDILTDIEKQIKITNRGLNYILGVLAALVTLLFLRLP